MNRSLGDRHVIIFVSIGDHEVVDADILRNLVMIMQSLS